MQCIPISVDKHSFENGIHHVFNLVLVFLELKSNATTLARGLVHENTCEAKHKA